jgi:hypothetical protein
MAWADWQRRIRVEALPNEMPYAALIGGAGLGVMDDDDDGP